MCRVPFIGPRGVIFIRAARGPRPSVGPRRRSCGRSSRGTAWRVIWSSAGYFEKLTLDAKRALAPRREIAQPMGRLLRLIKRPNGHKTLLVQRAVRVRAPVRNGRVAAMN